MSRPSAVGSAPHSSWISRGFGKELKPPKYFKLLSVGNIDNRKKIGKKIIFVTFFVQCGVPARAFLWWQVEKRAIDWILALKKKSILIEDKVQEQYDS